MAEFLGNHYQALLGIVAALIWIGGIVWYLIRDRPLAGWWHERQERRRRGGF